MRRMSFALTTEQMRAHSKFVTRRLGWRDLKVDTELLAVDRVMGFKPGQKAVPLAMIKVLDVRRERLDEIVRPGPYGAEEMRLEGFPGRDPQDFLHWLCARERELLPDSLITRIHFGFLTAPSGAEEAP